MKLFIQGDADQSDADHSFGWWVLATDEDATNGTEAQEVIDLLRELPLGPKEIARQLGR